MTAYAKAQALDCPECGAPMKLRSSRYGLFYGCTKYPACNGTHGAHPNGAPLGTPADAETKAARIRAHAVFDALWKGPKASLTRCGAYLELQSKMGLRSDEAHIGKFTKEQCEQLIRKLNPNQGAVK